MFKNLVRRFSSSFLPRSDRPWSEDATSNAPQVGQKRRLRSPDDEEDEPDPSSASGSLSKRLRLIKEEDELERDYSPAPARETTAVREIRQGVTEVELNERIEEDEEDADGDTEPEIESSQAEEKELENVAAAIPLPEPDVSEGSKDVLMVEAESDSTNPTSDAPIPTSDVHTPSSDTQIPSSDIQTPAPSSDIQLPDTPTSLETPQKKGIKEMDDGSLHVKEDPAPETNGASTRLEEVKKGEEEEEEKAATGTLPVKKGAPAAQANAAKTPAEKVKEEEEEETVIGTLPVKKENGATQTKAAAPRPRKAKAKEEAVAGTRQGASFKGQKADASATLNQGSTKVSVPGVKEQKIPAQKAVKVEEAQPVQAAGATETSSS